MIKHVIFDCDGVLVDTEIVATEIILKILEGHGVTMSKEHYMKTCSGKTITTIYNSLLSLTDEEVVKLAKQSDKQIYERLSPINGMQEVVKSIAMSKSVVSNSSLWQVEKALKFTNLEKYFDGIFAVDMVEHPKPAPDLYLMAAKEAGYKPEECLVIEDSQTGVTAAMAAGTKVIGFTGASHILPGHDKVLKEIGAIQTTDSPKVLLQLINDFLKS